MSKKWFEELAEQFIHDPDSIGRRDVRRLIQEVRKLHVEQLRDTIRFHAHLYYNLDRNEITDHQYDQMFKRLQEIEEKHPDWVTKDSPTQLVGQAISAPLSYMLRCKK